MDWDELTKMKKIFEEQERVERQAALYSSVSSLEALRHSAIGDVSAAYAAQCSAGQHIQSEERVRQLAMAGSAGQNALYAANLRLEAEARLSQLASGSTLEAITASMQIAEKASRRQNLGNLLSGGMAVSLAAAEETRLRQLVDNAIGVGHLAATSQVNTLAQLYTDQLRETVNGRFLLLGTADTERMLDVMRGNYFGNVLDRYGNQLPGAQKAMLAMQAP